MNKTSKICEEFDQKTAEANIMEPDVKYKGRKLSDVETNSIDEISKV